HVERAPAQIRRRHRQRPLLRLAPEIEVHRHGERERHALDGDQPHQAPPHQAVMTELVAWQAGDVERAVVDGRFYRASASSFSRRLGQNQMVTAIVTGTPPQTIAHGVKMLPMKITVTALTNGQTVGCGKISRWLGIASSTVVTSASRTRSASPTTCVGSAGGS